MIVVEDNEICFTLRNNNLCLSPPTVGFLILMKKAKTLSSDTEKTFQRKFILQYKIYVKSSCTYVHGRAPVLRVCMQIPTRTTDD